VDSRVRPPRVRGYCHTGGTSVLDMLCAGWFF